MRESDNKTIRAILINLGRRLGYESHPEKSLVNWMDSDTHQIKYQFFIQSHTRINMIASVPNQSEIIRAFVLPGSRSNLLTYKIKTNPVLSDYMKDGWHVLKFRHITRLAENPMLTTDSLQLWLDNDPPEYQPVQMDLF